MRNTNIRIYNMSHILPSEDSSYNITCFVCLVLLAILAEPDPKNIRLLHHLLIIHLCISWMLATLTHFTLDFPIRSKSIECKNTFARLLVSMTLLP